VSVRISFVIPVRNDAVRLETCLRSIRAARSADDQVDVLVVDNGSTDRSADVARSLGARVLAIEDVRVSDLRNRGVSQTTGDVLAFVDADNEIVPGWIDAVAANLQNIGIGATGAQYKAPAGGTWVQRAYDLLRGRTSSGQDVDWLNSGNLAVRRDVFERVGGFDTSLETCEDVDLCHRIRAAGFRILGDSRLESVHHGDPRTLGALFKSELWRGRDNLRVSFRRPLDWPGVPSAILPVLDAALLGVGVSGLMGGLAAWPMGMTLTLSAVLLVAAFAFLKTVRAAIRERQAPGVVLLQAFSVACVYDVARALALFTRVPHRSVRPKAAATTAS
jgi:glycosyl transferase family 2